MCPGARFTQARSPARNSCGAAGSARRGEVRLSARAFLGLLKRYRPVVIVCALAFGSLGEAAARTGVPARLSRTGLYANTVTKVIAHGVRPYSPQYPLWSDGAGKSRWIKLPAGSKIDARHSGSWVFPRGTRLWKEFAFNGHRVETRLIEKQASGHWSFAAYAWNADETEAFLVPESGQPHVVAIAGGASHDIPSIDDCKACHVGEGRDVVLGFSALQLSSDRDPGAPHAEPVLPGMIDLSSLLREGIIAHAPTEWARQPPSIQGRSPRERSVLGYLQTNCGECHNADDGIAALSLVSQTGSPPGTQIASWSDAVGVPSSFQIPGLAPGVSILIQPGHPELSTLFFRMATRIPDYQMPPIGTSIVDKDAVNLIGDWIRLDLPAYSKSMQPNKRRRIP